MTDLGIRAALFFVFVVEGSSGEVLLVMRRARRLMGAGVISFVAATATVATAVSATPTSNSEPARQGELFASGLVGRPVDPNLNVAIRGVAPGAVPWALARGSTRLDANGRLSVTVTGLVITGTNSGLDGTTGPVTSVVASVTCDGSTPTMENTAPVPLSAQGDASINQVVALPAICEAPIVLVLANGGSGPWIAASGL